MECARTQQGKKDGCRVNQCKQLCQHQLVLGKFGFKPIQTWFEPKPNRQFQFQFGDSCHETKWFGFGLGNQ